MKKADQANGEKHRSKFILFHFIAPGPEEVIAETIQENKFPFKHCYYDGTEEALKTLETCIKWRGLKDPPIELIVPFHWMELESRDYSEDEQLVMDTAKKCVLTGEDWLVYHPMARSFAQRARTEIIRLAEICAMEAEKDHREDFHVIVVAHAVLPAIISRRDAHEVHPLKPGGVLHYLLVVNSGGTTIVSVF